MSRTRSLVLLTALMLVLGACDPADDTSPAGPTPPGPAPTAPTRTYVGYRYVNTLATGQVCEDLLENGINCTQWLLLDEAGRAEIMVTDIINTGTWLDQADTIETTWPNPGDVVPSIVFTKVEETPDLVDMFGTIWRQKTP